MAKNILALDLNELKEFLKEHNQKSYHAQQIFDWIYRKGSADFSLMSNLPAGLKNMLKDNFDILNLEIIKIQRAIDGTEKFLFKLKDGNLIESVVIPVKGRVTACISTQAGCKFACKFCASGFAGFKRNLTSAEMIEEVWQLRNNSDRDKLTHLVFMGTGEPFDNYEEVLKAVRIINSRPAFNIGARRITISTCGIIPGIERLADEGLQIELSVSLHSADDQARSKIMPVNKKYPLADLIRSCKGYIKKTNRQITFEYVMVKNLNSDLPNARKVVKILAGLNCKV
ncbi:MAG: 23S rRNA (adenine(2503)-C(2))-methyltransferase RlmN, partial [Candidatus Omnitrophica bacterium]|nr:23S rRNA (adenine(2503)-C(2))-methyltransferase RlmN [Candidatus Omnitrophota bacterium]